MSSGMDWTNLGEPRPKSEPSRYVPRFWPCEGYKPLSRVDSLPQGDISEQLFARRSCRWFDAAPSESSLGHLLYLTAFSQGHEASPYGFDLSRACAPSAGAIHGIHIFVVPASDNSAWHYDPSRHSLGRLTQSAKLATKARADAAQLTHLGSATLLLLVAEPGMYAAKYHACESLVWRDAGVLIGYMSVVAEVLGLDFCPLGITGSNALDHLGQQSQLLGVGVAVVGGRHSKL